MNIVYFGTGAFGVPALESLKNSRHRLAAVVTTASKARGRGLAVRRSIVGEWAEAEGLPVHEWSKPVPAAALESIRALSPDVFVVIAFGMILTREMLSIPSREALNVHSSLLPKYRGAAPIHWALLNGDAETGVTVIRMAERLDAGDIVARKATPIGVSEDFQALENRLAALGAEALMDALDRLEKGALSGEPQDESRASYARKIVKEDARIRWERPAREIADQVRALSAWPVAQTAYSGSRIFVHAAAARPAASDKAAPGTVLASGGPAGLEVAAGDGILRILRLQKEGGRPLEADAFLRGFRIPAGALLE